MNFLEAFNLYLSYLSIFLMFLYHDVYCLVLTIYLNHTWYVGLFELNSSMYSDIVNIATANLLSPLKRLFREQTVR